MLSERIERIRTICLCAMDSLRHLRVLRLKSALLATMALICAMPALPVRAGALVMGAPVQGRSFHPFGPCARATESSVCLPLASLELMRWPAAQPRSLASTPDAAPGPGGREAEGAEQPSSGPSSEQLRAEQREVWVLEAIQKCQSRYGNDPRRLRRCIDKARQLSP